jgi:CheY-like chemotaxis protein
MKPKVVLIDDNNIVNFINRRTIESCGFSDNILEYTSAKKALKFLGEAAKEPEQIPDLIFLDIKMQLMNGFEFLENFSKLPASVKGKAKIIMLSSSLLDTDKKHAMQFENVIAFFNKPITRDKLSSIKIQLLN